MRQLTAVCATFLILFGCTPEKPKEELSAPLEAFQKKMERPEFIWATWSKAPKGKFNRKLWQSRMARYQALGLTDVLVQATAKQLEQIVPIAQQNKLRIHAWVKILNRPRDPIPRKNREWYAVNRLGQNSLDFRPYVRYYEWLSPFHPEVVDYLKNELRTYLKIEGIESLHLDYIRYSDIFLGTALQKKYKIQQESELPQFDFGYHPIARKKFFELFGLDPIKLQHPELNLAWHQFRLKEINSLVQKIRWLTDSAKIKLSAAVFPYPALARKNVRQDWSIWPLHEVYPMLYHNFYEQEISWINFALQQLSRAQQKKTVAGLFLPALQDSATLAKAIYQTSLLPIKGISFFSIDHLPKQKNEVLKQIIKNHMRTELNLHSPFFFRQSNAIFQLSQKAGRKRKN